MRALRGYVVGGVGVVGGSASAVGVGGSASSATREDVVAIDEGHARHLSTADRTRRVESEPRERARFVKRVGAL